MTGKVYLPWGETLNRRVNDDLFLLAGARIENGNVTQDWSVNFGEIVICQDPKRFIWRGVQMIGEAYIAAQFRNELIIERSSKYGLRKHLHVNGFRVGSIADSSNSLPKDKRYQSIKKSIKSAIGPTLFSVESVESIENNYDWMMHYYSECSGW